MIVLTILKVIGIILLVFLLLILLILGILLFVPIRYNSNGYKHEETKDYFVRLDATWLLRALRFNATYDSTGFKMYLKFLWMTLMQSPEEIPEAETADSTAKEDTAATVTNEAASVDIPEKNVTESAVKKEDTDTLTSVASTKDISDQDSTEILAKENTPEDVIEQDTTEKSSDVIATKSDIDQTTNAGNCISQDSEKAYDPEGAEEVDNMIALAETEEDKAVDIVDDKVSDIINDKTIKSEDGKVLESEIDASNAADDERENTSFYDRIKTKFNAILDKISDIIKKVSDLKEKLTNPDNIAAFKLILKNTKYLLRHYKFRKLKGSFTYGSDDPYSVGQIMTYLSLFYPVYGDDFSIEPVFDRQVIMGDIFFKGRIRLIHLLIAIIDLMRNKIIRQAVVNHFKEDTDG